MACDCKGKTGFGKWLGNVGSQVGDSVTDRASKLFKSWTGFGDYDIKYNSLINNTSGVYGAMMGTDGRTMTVRYKEYIGDVFTHPTNAGQFMATTYAVNPGNLFVFPWLHAIAQNYEQYVINGMFVEYRSYTSDASTAGIGQVIISTDYNVDEAPPQSREMMFNNAYCSTSKSSETQMHGLECAPRERKQQVYFVRSYGQPVVDIKDYDFANITVATAGGDIAANTNIGSLYLHYDITFLKEEVYAAPSVWRVPLKSYFAPAFTEATWIGLNAQYLVTGTTPADPVNFANTGMAYRYGTQFNVTFSTLSMTIPRMFYNCWFKIVFTAKMTAIAQTVCSATVSNGQLANRAAIKSNIPEEALWTPLCYTGDTVFKTNQESPYATQGGCTAIVWVKPTSSTADCVVTFNEYPITFNDSEAYCHYVTMELIRRDDVNQWKITTV